MITKAALRASAKARKEGSNREYLKVLAEGEAAKDAGLSKDSNPYAGTDWAEVWDFGWGEE